MNKIVGGCMCGAIRYSGESPPVKTFVCHCKICQRQTGTAFSILVAVPKGSLKIVGTTLASIAVAGDSGRRVMRYFCRDCGSPIYSEAEATPDLDLVKAGTLDDVTWLQPQAHIWCDSAQPWFSLELGVPRFGKNPGFKGQSAGVK